MKIKLDENLGKSAAAPLLEAGHDVATVPGQGLCSAADRDVLGASRRECRCLVTLDLGFANPLVFKPSEYRGIAVLRTSGRTTLADLLVHVRTLRDALATNEIDRRLWIVEPGRVRVHQDDESD